MTKPDIHFETHGSVPRFVPLTRVADRWIKENVRADECRWFGGVYVEPQYASDILKGAVVAGLEVGH